MNLSMYKKKNSNQEKGAKYNKSNNKEFPPYVKKRDQVYVKKVNGLVAT